MQRLLRLLSDPTRVRILAAVQSEELAVNEIADVLGMSQSRISNHLRLLRNADALRDRREGAWTFYRNALPDQAARAPLWSAVREGLRDDPGCRADEARRRKILERRRRRSRAHFAAQRDGNAAEGLERGILREEILAALLPSAWVAADMGCGDGFLTEALAGRFDRVLAFDHSPERLRAARRRVKRPNVTFQQGEVDALPVSGGTVDVCFLSMVLHHVPEISAALKEARRVLKPKGTVVVADLVPHDDESMRTRMGDLRLGIEPGDLLRAMEEAGFRDARILPAQDRLKVGPRRVLGLFLATGRRAGAARKTKRKRREP